LKHNNSENCFLQDKVLVNILPSVLSSRRCRDSMGGGFTTTYAISAYHH